MTSLPEGTLAPTPDEPLLDVFLVFCRDCGSQDRNLVDDKSFCARCNSSRTVDSPSKVLSWFDEAQERDAFDHRFEPAHELPAAASEMDPQLEEPDEVDYHHASYNSSCTTTSQFSHRLQVLHRHARGSQRFVGWDGSPREMQLYDSHCFLTAAHHFGDHTEPTSSTTTPSSNAKSPDELLAKNLLEQRDFRHITCHQLLDFLDLKSSNRQCLQNEPQGQAIVLGLYSHGNFHGRTKATKRHRWLCRYINEYLRFHGLYGCTTSLSISKNAPASPHKDSHNLKGTVNWQITLGSYSGGRTWVQTSQADRQTVDREYFGKRYPGYLCDTRNNLVAFSPDKIHATEKFTGTRWSIVAYTSRSLPETTASEKSRLCRLGFNPRPTRTAYPTTATSEASDSDTPGPLIAGVPQPGWTQLSVLEAHPSYEEGSSLGTKENEFMLGMEYSSEDGNDGTFESGRAARQARKKELPWKAMTEEEIPQFREALQAEWAEWTKWSSCKPVWLDPRKISSHLILRSRVCYRWKPKTGGGFKPKARIVVAGFRDPHLPLLTRDAPVLSRAGFVSILQWTTTYCVRLWNGDCRSAFLQGKAGSIWLRPPVFGRGWSGPSFGADSNQCK